MKIKTWIHTHPYCLAWLYFIFYLSGFFMIEKCVKPRYIIHCVLDDWIPFCEWFVIPYCTWFILLVGALAYAMFYSKEDFEKLCFLMFTGMTICLALYVILPNGLNLRPTILKDNLLCKWVSWLYQADTPTNVCPSIHVASSVAIYEVTKRSNLFKERKMIKIAMWVLVSLICLSTLFLKQHSVIDVVLGYLLTKGLSYMVYYTNCYKWIKERLVKGLEMVYNKVECKNANKL